MKELNPELDSGTHMDSLKRTKVASNNDVAILLVHGMVILDLESLQALDKLLVDRSARGSRLIRSHGDVAVL